MFTKLLSVTAALMLSLAGFASGNGGNPTKFTVRIENITEPDSFTASNGVKWSLAFSPGLGVVHTDKAPIFTSGKMDRGQGLEAQSEDGDPGMLAKSLEGGKGIKSVTVFNTPVGASAPGPITPGAAYEFTISGAAGDRFSLTTMMGQSNDWFYGPDDSGISLFKDGKPVSGDITSQIILWDVGTEVNQEPGIGADQGPRQKAPNTGKAENGMVRNIKDVKDGSVFSKVSSVMRVTIRPAQ
ncbi:MAG TPA: spondin domain-containing protein [Candidatus Udaeobacter sp.]|nr:spondin domain-containing protein [Candidatus Udaeobacter sp.]